VQQGINVVEVLQDDRLVEAVLGPRTTMAGEGKTTRSSMKTKIEMPIRITRDVPKRRIR